MFLFTLYQAKALIIFHYTGERNAEIASITLLLSNKSQLLEILA